MDISIKKSTGHSNFSESTLIWAVICSVLLHILLAVVLPNFKFDTSKEKPQPLTIEIMQPSPPAPVAMPQPVVEPEPIKPEPIKKPKPITEPVKPIPKKSPEPISQPTPIQETNPEPSAEPPPNVISTAPKTDTQPVITVPPPEPPRKMEPSDNDVNNALNQYGNTLGRAIAKHKNYPKIAQMRGWQGECLLDLKIDSNGNVLSASIKQTSGYDALDNQALEMVRKASPFPAPPEALRGRSFNITVPVSFKLEGA